MTHKTISTALALLLLETAPGCIDPSSGCEYDEQCTQGRVCQLGACVDVTGHKQCGETVVACNCNSTSLQPGQITNNTTCESGQGVAAACPGSCGGGVPWTVTCHCEESPPVCGDGQCDPGESCPADCGTPTCDLSGHYSGPVECQPLGTKGQLVADTLVGVWSTSPTYICGYSSFNPPVTGCGQMPPNNAAYCPIDGGVAADFDMLNMLDVQFGNLGSIAVLAHEWGHLNQHALGFLNGASTINHELHADCQAGLFTAAMELSGSIEMGDVQGAFMSICGFGDPQGYPWFAPGAHGSCQMRTAAFQQGYLGGLGAPDVLCSSSALDAVVAICGVP